MRIFYAIFISLLTTCPLVVQAQVAKTGLEKIVGGISLRQLQQQVAVQGGVRRFLQSGAASVSSSQLSAVGRTKAVRSVDNMVNWQRATQGGEIPFTLPQAPSTVLHAVKIQLPIYTISEGIYFAPNSYVVKMPDGDYRIFTEEAPLPVRVHTAIQQAQQRPIQELAEAIGGVSVQAIHPEEMEKTRGGKMPRNTKGVQSIQAIAEWFSQNAVHFTLPQANETTLKAIEVPIPLFAIDERVFLAQGSYIVEMPDGDYRIFTEAAPMTPTAQQALQQARQVVEQQAAQFEEQRVAARQKLEEAGFSEEDIRIMMKNWEAAHSAQ